MRSRLVLLFPLFVACAGVDDDTPDRDGGVAQYDGGAVRDAGSTPDAGTPDGGDETVEAIIEVVQPMIDEGWYPSVSIAWVEAGEVRYLGLGETGPGGAAPTPDTLYEIGSVTKTFTGTLLGDMIANGEVTADATAQSVAWPTLTMPTRAGAPEITLEDLATHFSALPRLPSNLAPADPTDPYVDYTTNDLETFLAGYALPRAPGASFEYSNLGVGLLGQLLAHTASTTYTSLLQTRVLEPLGMMDTTFVLDAEQQTRLAPGYDYNGEPTSNWDLGIFDPAGGLESSARDMMLYAQGYLDRTTLADAIDEATTPRGTLDPSVSVGLNWFIGAEAIFHDGATGGYNALFVLVPDDDLAVVVLTNGSGYQTGAMGFAVVQAIRGRATNPPDPKPTVPVESSVLAANAGDYRLVNGNVRATVTVQGEDLWFMLDQQPPLKLFATSDQAYYVRAVEASVTFDAPDGNGDVDGFQFVQGAAMGRFERTP